MRTPPRYVVVSAVFVVVTSALLAAGAATGEKTVEMVGGLLLGGTFIPLPLDVYVLHLSRSFDPVLLAIVAGALNTVAVLFERTFLRGLLASGRGLAVREAVTGSKLSGWFRRAPFAVLVVTGFSFLPFEPFRFLAVSNDYDVRRYAAATLVGRGVRYGVLVSVGEILAEYGWLGTALAIGLVLYFISLLDVRNLRRMFQPADPERTGAAGGEGEAAEGDAGERGEPRDQGDTSSSSTRSR